MAKVVRAVVGVFAALLYVWYAAVRSAPSVKRRKAERRRLRLARLPWRNVS